MKKWSKGILASQLIPFFPRLRVLFITLTCLYNSFWPGLRVLVVLSTGHPTKLSGTETNFKYFLTSFFPCVTEACNTVKGTFSWQTILIWSGPEEFSLDVAQPREKLYWIESEYSFLFKWNKRAKPLLKLVSPEKTLLLLESMPRSGILNFSREAQLKFFGNLNSRKKVFTSRPSVDVASWQGAGKHHFKESLS